MKTSLTTLSILFVLFITITLNTVFAQTNTLNESTLPLKKSNLELSKIKVIPISDSKTKRQYELYIKLPEGYSKDSKTKYPVLYFTDAMWHIEILSGSSEYLMKNLILV